MNGINTMTAKTILNKYLTISNFINIFNKNHAKAEEDALVLRLTEEAWEEMEAGDCITMDGDDYLRELEKW